MKKAFEIIGTYGPGGIDAVIQGRALRLKPEDVNYLLVDVDGHATQNAEHPPAQVGLMLYGEHVVASNEEWTDFVDRLQSAAGAGGWRGRE